MDLNKFSCKECQIDLNVVYDKWLPSSMEIVKNSTDSTQGVH